MTAKPQTQSKNNPKTDEKEGPFVLISTTHGKPRRRAGLRFTPEGTRVDVSTLDEDQRDAIQGDPVLKIKEIED